MLNLVITFREKIVRLVSKGEGEVKTIVVATGEVVEATGEEKAKFAKFPLVGDSYAAGPGAVYPEDIIKHFDEERNSLTFEKGWTISGDGKIFRITCPGRNIGRLQCNLLTENIVSINFVNS